MADRDLSCGCSVMENTGQPKLDGTLLKVCKLHVDWMTDCIAAHDQQLKCDHVFEVKGEQPYLCILCGLPHDKTESGLFVRSNPK